MAFAKVDLRLVDSQSGLVYSTISGAGETSTEAGSVFGFGSRAGYDGTLNDGAIRVAISEAVNQLISKLDKRTWRTDILSVEGSNIYISGGEAQGISPGMIFAINTQGKQIKSQQSGGTIQLPGKQIAQLKIESTFGDDELSQGSVGVITNGSIQGQATNTLEVVFMGAPQ